MDVDNLLVMERGFLAQSDCSLPSGELSFASSDCRRTARAKKLIREDTECFALPSTENHTTSMWNRIRRCLWAIRDSIGMTGTKYGCGIAQCGACTVHIDGAAARSCGVTASDAVGKNVTTIEGLAANGVLTEVQKAWVDLDVPQCGYCQSGMIMAVSALLKENPKPTDADIDNAITNICRCGTFQQVRAAIHAAASA